MHHTNYRVILALGHCSGYQATPGITAGGSSADGGAGIAGRARNTQVQVRIMAGIMHRHRMRAAPASSPIDDAYAHKPSVIWHNGALHHFLCAVSGKYPNDVRGISVAQSRKWRP